MVPTEFAQTGFAARRSGSAEIRRFQVIGERSSGTNYAKRLLGRNTGLTPSEDLGWKHGFAQSMAIPPDLAVIVTVRRADAWALSMHAKPWHCTPGLQALAFSDFIRAPWHTIIDRPRYFGGASARPLVGQPLQQDRDPISGACFGNIFALRRAKLAHALGYLARECTAIVLRMEDMIADPDRMLGQICEGLGAARTAEVFRPVHKRLGSKFKPAIADRPLSPDHMDQVDIAFLKTQVDPAQESALGYSYDL